MLRGKKPHGFTIVELMIFLAVSGALFLSAAALVSGRQSSTQFESAVRQTLANIQSIDNNVKSGYYGNRAPFNCTPGYPSATTPPTFSSPVTTANTEGGNAGCVFLGQAIQFEPSTNNPNEYIVYTVAANQYTDANTPTSPSPVVANLTQANPTVVEVSGVGTEIDTVRLPDGLSVPDAYYEDTTTGATKQKTSVVSILTSFSGYSGSSLTSGSIATDLIPVPTTSNNATFSRGITRTTAVNDVNGICNGTDPTNNCTNCLTGTFVCSSAGGLTGTKTIENPSGGYVICLEGDSTQFATITIGANGDPNNINLQFISSTQAATVCN